MHQTQLHDTVAEELTALGVRNSRLLVAVSGGPDSVGLCRILFDLRSDFALDLFLGHVNHGLRPGAAQEDEDFVRDLAYQLGLPFLYRKLAPSDRQLTQRRKTVEEWARDSRYAALTEMARECAARFLATGHTADDQAETVLLRIIRGTGIAGLTGIPVRRSLATDLDLIRPALRLRRGAIISWLDSIGQGYRIDSMNEDPAFTRNRIRHEVLPLLHEINPRVEEAICRLSSAAAEVMAVLDPLTAELGQRAVLYNDGKKVILSAPALQRAPGMLVRELFRQLWAENNWPQQQMGLEEWVRLESLVFAQEGSFDLPGSLRARRFGGTLVVQLAGDECTTSNAQVSKTVS